MMRRLLTPIVFLGLGFLLTTGLCRGAEDGYVPPSLLRVPFQGDVAALSARVQEAGGEIVSRGRQHVDVLISRDQLLSGAAFAMLGTRNVEVLYENLDDMLIPFHGRTDAGAYHTNAEVAARIQGWVASHGSIVHHEVIGQSIEGRPIHAVRVTGAAGPAEEKPTFLFCGLHHSREWISVEVPMAILEWLIEGYGEDALATEMVDAREIWVVPVVNPDGLEYSQTQYKMWRKNRRANGDGSMGVDLNRNFGYNWGLPGASDNPGSDTYRGTSAFSEPETRALRDLALREGVVSAISYHSYSELVLWPWGYTYDPAPDDDVLGYHGRKMGELVGYEPKQSSDLYPTSGDFDDWFYGELGALAYTYELGTQFVPPESQIPAIVAANMKAARYFLENCADPFPLMTPGTIADTTDTEGPYRATAKLSRRYQADDPIQLAELVFRLPGAAGWVRVPMTKGAQGVYAAPIPATGDDGTYRYHFEVTTRDGEHLRFPEQGELDFQVVERLFLLVDDDKGANHEGAYVEALEALGLPHAVRGSQGLEVADLLGATAVIWFTGSDSSTTLTDEEQDLLIPFLEGGGSLLLCGQDIGYDIKGSTFYEQLMRAEYVADDAGTEDFSGVPGSFLAGFSAAINGPGAATQSYPEVIAARDGAEPLIAWAGDPGSGGLSVDAAYRLVYLGFGLEGIAGPASRAELLGRCLDWLTEASAARTARRATALRAVGGGASHPRALAGMEAAVLREARRLGARDDREGLRELRRELPAWAEKPLLRAYWQALHGARRRE